MTRSESVRVIRTPIRTPRANAFAERFVRTIRRECPDRMLIVNRRYFETVIHEFVDHYNHHRRHRSLGRLPPLPSNLTSTRRNCPGNSRLPGPIGSNPSADIYSESA